MGTIRVKHTHIGNHSVSMGFLTLNTTQRHGHFLKLTFDLETSKSKKNKSY